MAATLRPGNVHSADGWDKVLLPAIDRYRNRGQIVDPASPSHASWVREAQDAARALGMRLQPVAVRDPSEIDSAFAEMVNEQAGAVIVSTDTMFFIHRARIADLAAQRCLPLVAPARQYVEAGGLMADGVIVPDLYRRATIYVDKILKGAKPGDLPVEQPASYQREDGESAGANDSAVGADAGGGHTVGHADEVSREALSFVGLANGAGLGRASNFTLQR